MSNSFYISGSLSGTSGYDNLVLNILSGLRSLNVDIKYNTKGEFNPSLFPAWISSLRFPKPSSSYELIITPPCFLKHYSPSSRSILFSMWECDRLDSSWVEEINKCSLVIVPSKWVYNVFRSSGVSAEIVKIPLGFDPLFFHYLPTKVTKECIFGTAAAVNEEGGGSRKNIPLIISSFIKAFPISQYKDVRLKIKLSPKCKLSIPSDSRIEILRSNLSNSNLASWYRSLTAFINTSSAEGFSLHCLESLACGIPLISHNYSGISEYFDSSVRFEVSHSEVEANTNFYKGKWSFPDEESLIDNLRLVYSNRALALDKGIAAANKARIFTWKECIHRIYDVLKSREII